MSVFRPAGQNRHTKMCNYSAGGLEGCKPSKTASPHNSYQKESTYTVEQRITRPIETIKPKLKANLPQTIITLNDVDRSFSEDVGVFDLTFQVQTGTIFGLIGPSGCGKTTTVRLLTGLYKPNRGIISVLNRSPSKFSPRMRELIGYMPQQFVLYPNLTVWENLNFVASLYGMGYFSRRKQLEYVLDFVELSDV